jgi:crotonobetainyl-CoA:carnitine CoA-transferase CaiB-like acyl-CoA transferase
MSVGIGEPGRPPLTMPLMQSAIQGGLVAATAAMGALAGPDDTAPSVVDISETDVWATIHAGTTMVSFLFANRLRRREGRRVLGQPYPHQLFRCRDGFIAIQGSERHQYQAFVEMVGSPEWITDRRFGSRLQMNTKHADEIDALLAPWFLARTRAEVFAECRRRKIPAAPVYSVDEVRRQPELRDRDCLETYRGATGVDVTVPAPPFRFREAVLRPAGPVPGLEGD